MKPLPSPPLAATTPGPDAGTVRIVEVERAEPSCLPRLWGARELSIHWQVSKRQIYRWHAEGKLPGLRVLGVLRFREDDLLHLLEQGQDGGRR